MVQELLERHADGRIHPVTRYSPLYIACFKGRKDVVQIVLKVSAAVRSDSWRDGEALAS